MVMPGIQRVTRANPEQCLLATRGSQYRTAHVGERQHRVMNAAAIRFFAGT